MHGEKLKIIRILIIVKLKNKSDRQSYKNLYIICNSGWKTFLPHVDLCEEEVNLSIHLVQYSVLSINKSRGFYAMSSLDNTKLVRRMSCYICQEPTRSCVRL